MCEKISMTIDLYKNLTEVERGYLFKVAEGMKRNSKFIDKENIVKSVKDVYFICNNYAEPKILISGNKEY